MRISDWSSDVCSSDLIGLDSRHDALVTDHPDYWQDGNTPFARQAKYSQRLAQGLSEQQSRRIQDALFGHWVLGGTDFLAQIERRATRRIDPARTSRGWGTGWYVRVLMRAGTRS